MKNKTTKLASKVTNKYIMPVLQVVIAIISVAVLLGLAYKGAKGYLIDIQPEQQTVGAIMIVVLLAYAIATGFKRITK